MTTDRSVTTPSLHPPREARLWIDGVGCWMLWLPDRLTIGGAGAGGAERRADLPLLADLRTRHAAIERQVEHYRLLAMQAAFVNGSPVEEQTLLRSGDEITLGRDVRYRFEIPSPLSGSARLVCESGHRPVDRIDGFILLEQACLVGPDRDDHIGCPAAGSALVLFRKGNALWCRSSEEWTLDGRAVAGAASLGHGAIVSTATVTIRVEMR